MMTWREIVISSPRELRDAMMPNTSAAVHVCVYCMYVCDKETENKRQTVSDTYTCDRLKGKTLQ